VTRILLADDHPMIRTAIEVLLRNSSFELAGTATTADEALRAVPAIDPDIILLDLQMPGGSGMELVRELRSNGDQRRLVILTAAIDDRTLVEARSLGVEGMVLKNSDPGYLLECLEQVSAGSTWTDPELIERLDQMTQTSGGRGGRRLAPRERELIKFVRQGLRNREIARELGVTEGTVKAYLHEVFDKLGVKNRTELAIRADEFLAAN
jgi:two-component system nitrate/nitrite response regulator NarL